MKGAKVRPVPSGRNVKRELIRVGVSLTTFKTKGRTTVPLVGGTEREERGEDSESVQKKTPVTYGLRVDKESRVSIRKV